MGRLAMSSLRLTSSVGVLALAVLAVRVQSTSKCPGEGARYGDYKCTHDPTHRVCAQLKSPDGSKMMWGNGKDFWQTTGQPDWSTEVGKSAANPGGDWCICMWATASLIHQVGCDNVHIDCAATDVAYVENAYQTKGTDGGVDLTPAHQCIQSKCGGGRKSMVALEQLGEQLGEQADVVSLHGQDYT